MLKNAFRLYVIVLVVLCAQASFAQTTSSGAEAADVDVIDISRSACLPSKSLSAARKAADSVEGDLKSARSLARHYGECVEGAEDEVFTYSRKAAAFGFSEDVWNLAAILDDEGHHDEAFALFLKAAKQGESLATQRVARAYAEGVGTAKDNREAAVWWEAAARHCDAESASSLARVLRTGAKSDQLRALTWGLVSLKERRTDTIEQLVAEMRAGVGDADQRYAQELADAIILSLPCK